MMMRRRFCLAFSVLVLACLANLAQAQTFPFTGVAVSDGVNVRAGAGQNYYVVTQLQRGDLVQVYDDLYGWYRIAPPEGVFSYVSKDYIQPEAGGGTGIVTGQRVRVRAPSPAGPDKSYRTQLLLNEGDRVRILGSEGDFFKIVPPEDARLFVQREYIQPASPEQIAQARQAQPQPQPQPQVQPQPQQPQPAPQPQPQQPQVAQPRPQVTPEQPLIQIPTQPQPAQPQPQLGPVPDFSGEVQPLPPTTQDAAVTQPTTQPATQPAEAEVEEPSDQRLAALEERFLEITQLPLAEQPLDQMAQEYQALLDSGQLSAADAMLVGSRLDLIQTRLQLRRSLADIQEIREQLQRRPDPLQYEGAPATERYDAMGRLLASTLYTGERLPLLYRLVDPTTGLTIAYVKPAPQMNLASRLGQLVGIQGPKRYDPALKLNIIDVRQVDTLSPRDGG